jgi:hypothetical protein
MYNHPHPPPSHCQFAVMSPLSLPMAAKKKLVAMSTGFNVVNEMSQGYGNFLFSV